jgi:hypothetical protein
MANRTSWTAGNSPGYTWTAAFNSIDFTGAQPTSGQILLSTVTVSNQSNQDMFADFSIDQSIASSTIAAGANFAIWAVQQTDAGNYVSGLTAGTAGAATTAPPRPPDAVVPLYAATAQTTLIGVATGIIIPPGTFKWCIANNCGFTLTSTTQDWFYRTYNINLND